MPTIPNDVRNYIKLDRLIGHSYGTLRQLFKTRYSLFNNGQVWDDSPTCGGNYYANVIAKNKGFHLTSVQKISVQSSNSSEWDLTTLIALLSNINRPKTLSNAQIQQLQMEDNHLAQLRTIRNELAHHATKTVSDVEFNQLWNRISTILVAFGEDDTELDKLKDDSSYDRSDQPINEANVQEASRLNSLGTRAHKDRKYSDAIAFFTKAIILAGVSDHDRAIFYSNMSSSRLALYELKSGASSISEIENPADLRYRVLQDAKQARNLWQTWWKAHYRVGKAYASSNEHEKAIKSFERASALDPSNVEVQTALTDSRQIHARQVRHEHLDPRLQPKTRAEVLNEMKENMGVSLERSRLADSRIGKINPTAGDVLQGHKYEHGDIDCKQDYEQAAKYFAKAASQGNAEGLYNLARLTGLGLGVKKDIQLSYKLLEQAAAQSPQHPVLPHLPNVGVAEAEHSLGLRYADGVGVHKNLATAAYWYERGAKHGCANSANNLGVMYLEGAGVEKNLDKAEQLIEMAARGGDPNAMQTLATILFDKNDLKMAKIWFDRACESGNVLAQTNRNEFEKRLQGKQKLLDEYPPEKLRIMDVIQNILDSFKSKGSVSNTSNQSYIANYKVFIEYANRGSLTAKKMYNAIEHFCRALSVLMKSETLSEQEENLFIQELSQCYRLEHIVAQYFTVEMRQKACDTVDGVLRRCNTSKADDSLLDENARICYVVLNMDSLESIDQFLVRCKQKYPKSTFIFELSSAIYGWLKQYDASLYDSNTGLELDPSNCEILYHKAVALRLLGKDMKEAIQAYQAFLLAAPNDHRKVPESYYAMASCHLDPSAQNDRIDIVKKLYGQGEEAEKLQLPCFLPYKSNSKLLIKNTLNMETLLNASPPCVDLKKRLTNPHRIEIITRHRQWQVRTFQMQNDSKSTAVFRSETPPVKQRTANSLVGLKQISLREMDPTKDRVYEGYVLSVTIIEEAMSWSPSIHLVVEDERHDCEQMCIYNFPNNQGRYLTSTTYTIGTKMSIVNPYLRLGAYDLKPLIRIDDPLSIVMHNESERVMNMCRCCNEPNAPHVCGRCKQARYCSQECQVMDWKTYEHKLLCKKL
ncbi:unnamed protein product [Adineta ricciae]|uniref:MYND-type domain-containing protein n=2 Tax=Adineta ricciae TaxID=249248 RepID=A0A815Y0I9_ADIRI|nr:unnamed protein product [Adineta ricciae]